jgi:homoserine kinase
VSAVDWPGELEPVTVRVPATSANLGPGFDSLGLALRLHDVVTARITASGLSVEVSGTGEATSGNGEDHLVVRAMRAAFELIGEQPPGIALRSVNAIPHGFGLGSSAAAIVAGVLAARALTASRGLGQMPDALVLQLAAEIEGHADNVAACLGGGLTISWKSGAQVRSARLEPVTGLTPVLCVPGVPLPTELARRALPSAVPHANAAMNAARSALLIAALTQPRLSLDLDLLLEATRDLLHQPYRASSMPETARLVEALREDGIPAVVSGAGPAVLALVTPGAAAGADAVAAVAAESGAGWLVNALDIDREGAVVQVAGPASQPGGSATAL